MSMFLWHRSFQTDELISVQLSLFESCFNRQGSCEGGLMNSLDHLILKGERKPVIAYVNHVIFS